MRIIRIVDLLLFQHRLCYFLVMIYTFLNLFCHHLVSGVSLTSSLIGFLYPFSRHIYSPFLYLTIMSVEKKRKKTNTIILFNQGVLIYSYSLSASSLALLASLSFYFFNFYLSLNYNIYVEILVPGSPMHFQKHAVYIFLLL